MANTEIEKIETADLEKVINIKSPGLIRYLFWSQLWAVHPSLVFQYPESLW